VQTSGHTNALAAIDSKPTYLALAFERAFTNAVHASRIADKVAAQIGVRMVRSGLERDERTAVARFAISGQADHVAVTIANVATRSLRNINLNY